MLPSLLRKEARGLAVRASALRRTRLAQDLVQRATLSTASDPGPSTLTAPSALPWFMDPEDAEPSTPSPYARRSALQQASARPLAPLPAAMPSDHPIALLHAALKTSPHLEPGTLLVREPIPTATGPPLPDAMPKGRRKRGRTYLGEGVAENLGGPWEWIVIAQVKEGTENRGAIESVIRIVRKTLLTSNPPLPLPPNNKRRVGGGWAMVDVGDFAVHILSKDSREKFFPERRDW